MPLNTWAFVGVVRNNNAVSLYVNGSTQNATISYSTPTYGTETTKIGTYVSGAGGGEWPGSIDDVRIYNRALSPQEVAQLYDAGQVNIGHVNTLPNIGLNSGLVGEWIDGGEYINWNTGTVQDTSGNGNAGQMVGMSTTSSPVVGKIGQALQFNGTSQYMSIPDSASLRPAATSACAWFNLSTLPSTPAAIVTKPLNGPPWTSPYLSWLLRINNSTTMEFDLTNGSSFTANTVSVSLATDKWYFTCLTYDGSNNLAYLNGIPIKKSTATSGSIGYTSEPILIGTDTGGPREYFPGIIDDVRVYNRALSPQEVAQLYQMGR